MNYAQCVHNLFSIGFEKGMKFGLQNIARLCEALGHPERIPAVHVAGTNGKGSVTKKIATALMNSGMRIGLYTSPHIATFRERIEVQGKMISKESVVEHILKVFAVCEREGIPATFFECITALAFSYFQSQQVEMIVLETGLGGRLDATNVCLPILSVITSISVDHTQFLGQNIEQIASEKAGIIKQEVPVLCGPRVPKEVIRKRAYECSSPIYFVDPVRGHFEEENRAVAKNALELLKVPAAAIEEGLKALPPCRFEQVPVEQLHTRFGADVPQVVLLDVAHNSDGLKELFNRIKTHEKWSQVPITALFGISADKDVDACLHCLLREVENAVFIQAPLARAMPAQELQVRAEMISGRQFFATACIEEGMQEAFQVAVTKRHILLICGTFYIMRMCRQYLGYREESDEEICSTLIRIGSSL